MENGDRILVVFCILSACTNYLDILKKRAETYFETTDSFNKRIPNAFTALTFFESISECVCVRACVSKGFRTERRHSFKLRLHTPAGHAVNILPRFHPYLTSLPFKCACTIFVQWLASKRGNLANTNE